MRNGPQGNFPMRGQPNASLNRSGLGSITVISRSGGLSIIPHVFKTGESKGSQSRTNWNSQPLPNWPRTKCKFQAFGSHPF